LHNALAVEARYANSIPTKMLDGSPPGRGAMLSQQ
jgi:hypothetical protein